MDPPIQDHFKINGSGFSIGFRVEGFEKFLKTAGTHTQQLYIWGLQIFYLTVHETFKQQMTGSITLLQVLVPPTGLKSATASMESVLSPLHRNT